MKEYTTPEQTAKLIELGLEKPKSISSIKVTGNIITTADDLIGEPPSVMGGKITANYSIGELIEMLPKEFDGELLEIAAVTLSYAKWVVRYPYGIIVYKNELIDALYNMVIKLKEEGVI
jgi:hypothetical protein